MFVSNVVRSMKTGPGAFHLTKRQMHHCHEPSPPYFPERIEQKSTGAPDKEENTQEHFA